MTTPKNSITTSLRSGASYIEIAGHRLTVGNECFRRTWRIGSNGLLAAESFHDKRTGIEWLMPALKQFAPTPAAELQDEDRTFTLTASAASSPVESESLVAELAATGNTSTVVYRFQIFPDVGGVRIRQSHITGGTFPVASALDTTDEDAPTGLEQDPLPKTERNQAAGNSDARDTLEALTLAPLHLHVTQITLHDQTDRHNELVFEQEWLLHTAEHILSLSGCLFYVEDIISGSGLIFLKEAPLPYAQPVSTPYDLKIEPEERRFCFTGHGADHAGYGYAFITLTYEGGTAGRIAAMQQYQRCLRPYVEDRDGMLLANTWGDRNRDGRIHAEFMAQEIEAGARLGVDVIQIDDGWEAGATSNSVRAHSAGGVWEGFYAAWDNFWAVNPERFPDGLVPLVKSAQEKGIRFGLWFGPDSADDFANWQRDADTIVRLHRELGVHYIKVDGIKIRSKVGEHNLHAFFDRVLAETAGRITFDLDVTAEVRPGYFGRMDVGPLFVENRYTDWRRYWPHQTLRNLWKLTHHIDPVRLRMEWLNHTRNQDKYREDPLAPIAYQPDYLFATVMFSSPLGWFEISGLPASYFAQAAPLVAVWKQHRAALFSGIILPIGDAPNGTAWTGFISVTADGSGAYLLLFREYNQRAEWSVYLPFLPNTAQKIEAVALFGTGLASLSPDKTLTAVIDDPQRFLFAYLPFKLSPADNPQ